MSENGSSKNGNTIKYRLDKTEEEIKDIKLMRQKCIESVQSKLSEGFKQLNAKIDLQNDKITEHCILLSNHIVSQKHKNESLPDVIQKEIYFVLEKESNRKIKNISVASKITIAIIASLTFINTFVSAYSFLISVR